MLSCRDVTDRASDYLDEELGLRTRLLVAMHILACRHCRRFVDQITATIRLVRRSGDELPSKDLEDGLVAKLRERRTSPSDASIGKE